MKPIIQSSDQSFLNYSISSIFQSLYHTFVYSKVIIIQVGSIGKWAPALAFWFVNKHSTKVVLRYCILFCKLTIIKCYVMMKLLYLAQIGVEVSLKFIAYIVVNHETLISTWRCQMGTENLLRGGRSIISRLITVISRGALTETDSLTFT